MVTITLYLLWALFSSLMSIYVLSGWFIALWVVLGFIIGYLGTVVIFGLIHVPILKRLKVNNRYTGYIAKSLAYFLNRYVFNIRVKVTGKKYIPKEGPMVIYGNHKSFADAFVVMEVVGRPVGFTPKDILFKYPILRDWFELLHCMKITRNDDRQTAKALVTAIKDVKNGYAMMVFPEGGIKDRSKEEMVQTRAGAFKIAAKSGATILPVTILGTLGTSSRMPFRRTKAKLIFHPPLNYSDYEKLSTAQIGDMVMAIINSGLKIE